MAGQLSPDGNYYWDGSQWARAVTPDGAWRWDGVAWRPAAQRQRSRAGTQTAALIAAGSIVALLALGGGAFALSRLVLQNVQVPVHALTSPSESTSKACSDNAIAGSPLTEGATLCGRQLGSSLVAADCTSLTSLPSELTAEETLSPNADWTPADVGMDSSGCHMDPAPKVDIAIDSNDEAQPNLVIVADFVPVNSVGSVGVRVACSTDGSCLDVMINGDETYSLAEGVPNGGWDDLKDGGLVDSRMHFGKPNRLIMRFVDGVVTVYLNGSEVTHTTPDRAQTSGFYGFYADNSGDGTLTQHVQLHQLYVFEA